jgi:5-hydroxyisourate hydrolase
VSGDGCELVGLARTDRDGRIREWPGAPDLLPAVYRLTFATGPYFARGQGAAFYPEVTVAFEVRDASQRYHLPLLVSQFGYSTYRGG